LSASGHASGEIAASSKVETRESIPSCILRIRAAEVSERNWNHPGRVALTNVKQHCRISIDNRQGVRDCNEQN
jgi:hypothetical protein